jgi:hypothetical protein
VRILQCEKETLQARISFEDVGLLSGLLVPFPRLLLQRNQPTNNIPFCVFNKSQSVRVTIATIVKVAHTETVEVGPPQKQESFPTEFIEDLCKLRNERWRGRDNPTEPDRAFDDVHVRPELLDRRNYIILSAPNILNVTTERPQ